MSVTYTSVIPPKKERPLKFKRSKSVSATFKAIYGAASMSLSLRTSLLLGAVLQSLLLVVLPTKYAVAPAIIYLGSIFIDAVLVTTGKRPNPYLEGMPAKKFSAMLPDENGELNGPGKEKVAVLLLGAKFNHPLGFFAPKAKDFGDWAQSMYSQLEDPENQDNGFLGLSGWNRIAENGATEVVTVSYWRNLEDVHNYAYSPLHRQAWKWWEDNYADLKHIGIMHEVFEAPAGLWEGIYANFQPTLMGASTFLRKGDKQIGGTVDDAWLSPIVDATRGKMRTSNGRRGLSGKLSDEDVTGRNVYV